MNFLGLGPGELILIAALGLIIFGPGKLPEIAAQVGRAVRDFRRSTTEITSEFQRSFQLEEPPPPPAPAGPAAPFASPAKPELAEQTAPTGARPEPPLADTTEWHWESGESEQQPVPARPADGTAGTSLWQWETPEQPAEPPAPTSAQPASNTDAVVAAEPVDPPATDRKTTGRRRRRKPADDEVEEGMPGTRDSGE
jgi:TatA/E family protein of Tat protein translocase